MGKMRDAKSVAMGWVMIAAVGVTIQLLFQGAESATGGGWKMLIVLGIAVWGLGALGVGRGDRK